MRTIETDKRRTRRGMCPDRQAVDDGSPRPVAGVLGRWLVAVAVVTAGACSPVVLEPKVDGGEAPMRAKARGAGELLDSFVDPAGRDATYLEGEPYDALTDPAEFLASLPKDVARIPDPPAELVQPKVVVSLAGLTCRVFDQQGDFERVYPVGVGVRRASTGRSITPVGHFRTHANRRNRYFYIWRRWHPEYFAGLPFIRIDARNSRGQNTYGLHGPITNPSKRGYVSHGCIRMRPDDAKELFSIVYAHPGTSVVIQQGVDYDRSGDPVDLEFPRHH